MIHFLFGTLWSVLFWVLYFGIGIVTTNIVIKMCEEEMYNYVSKNGKYYDEDDVPAHVAQIIFITILWPVVLAVIIIRYGITDLFWPALCKVITKVGDFVPKIEFSKKAENKDTN